MNYNLRERSFLLDTILVILAVSLAAATFLAIVIPHATPAQAADLPAIHSELQADYGPDALETRLAPLDLRLIEDVLRR